MCLILVRLYNNKQNKKNELCRNKVTSPMRASSASCHQATVPHPLCHSIVNEPGPEHCHNQSDFPARGEMLTAVGVSPFFFISFFPFSVFIFCVGGCVCVSLCRVLYSIWMKTSNICTWPQWSRPAMAMALLMQPLQLHYSPISLFSLPLANTSSLARPPPLKALNPPHNPQPSIAPALEGRSTVVCVCGGVKPLPLSELAFYWQPAYGQPPAGPLDEEDFNLP